MIFDGMDFKRSLTLGWRNAHEGDLDEDGRQVENNHVVIVDIKDCETRQEIRNGRPVIVWSAKNAPQCVKLGYTLTRMGYGPWKQHEVKGQFRTVPGLGVLFNGEKWKSCRVYLVHDGRVYTTSIKRKIEEKPL